MKKVINGKIYNTETAIEIAFASRGYRNDFRFYEETLYKTGKGRFFVAGEGNANSHWAESVDTNTRGPGSGIQSLDQDDALSWCEIHDVDADVIAEHFDIEDA